MTTKTSRTYYIINSEQKVELLEMGARTADEIEIIYFETSKVFELHAFLQAKQK